MSDEAIEVTRKRLRRFLRPYRVTDGRRFRLKDIDPRDTQGLASPEQAKQLLQRGVEALAEMQERLYAQDQWGVLLIFQAMDAAGKDGAIKHVMTGINPQGCQVYSFKAPSAQELDHDFLWRCFRALPERGRIGIFNRSYYEEVLIVRVHPELLRHQKLPAALVTDRIWRERFEDIAAFERYLARNGYVILKFFLHVSKAEQRERFLARIDEPAKRWKFSLDDVRERQYWDDYMAAYEDAIRHTAAEHAPWYVVPADRKWFARLVVAGAIHDALRRLDLRFPEVGPDKLAVLEQAREALLAEDGQSSRASGSAERHVVARASDGSTRGRGDDDEDDDERSETGRHAEHEKHSGKKHKKDKKSKKAGKHDEAKGDNEKKNRRDRKEKKDKKRKDKDRGQPVEADSDVTAGHDRDEER